PLREPPRAWCREPVVPSSILGRRRRERRPPPTPWTRTSRRAHRAAMMTFLAALRGKVRLVDHHLAGPGHHQHAAEPGETDRAPPGAEHQVTAGYPQHDREGIDRTLGLAAEMKNRIEA